MTGILNAADIRNLMIDEIGSDIGLYSTPQGPIRSIRIYDRRLPPEWAMLPGSSGLEVIIPLNPERVIRAKNMRTTFFANVWGVRFILHKPQRLVDGLPWAECSLERIDGVSISWRQMPPSDLNSEQWILTIEQMCQV
jgi:hypothetical protein